MIKMFPTYFMFEGSDKLSNHMRLESFTAMKTLVMAAWSFETLVSYLITKQHHSPQSLSIYGFIASFSTL